MNTGRAFPHIQPKLPISAIPNGDSLNNGPGSSHFSQINSPFREHTAALMSACLLATSLVCVAQISGNQWLILFAFLCCLTVMSLACLAGMTIQAALFFLPWSPLLKLTPDSSSFFTIALLLCCGLSLVQCRMKLTVSQVLLCACLTVLTLTAKILQGGSLSKGYFVWLVMLLLFPCVTRGIASTVSFRSVTLFFACGIVAAVIWARLTAHLPNISRYIIVTNYQSVLRFAGFYGDPNFYSAHITACLAGILVLLRDETVRIRQLWLSLIAIILFYCGLLSGSKTYAVVVVCLCLLWLPLLLEHRANTNGRKAQKRLLAGLACAIVLISFSPAFQTLIANAYKRFTEVPQLSGLTTGRTDIWLEYLHGFADNIPLTLFGAGYTDVNLFRKSSHSTIVQSVYQFGIVGIPLFAMWLLHMLAGMFPDERLPYFNRKVTIVLCTGAMLPWLSLDILLIDEIFLIPVYVMLGIAYASGFKEVSVTSHTEKDPTD